MVVKGAEFIGGRVAGNKAPVDGGNSAVEDAIIDTIDQPKIDSALGEHLRILAMSVSGMTAKQIAIESCLAA